MAKFFKEINSYFTGYGFEVSVTASLIGKVVDQMWKEIGWKRSRKRRAPIGQVNSEFLWLSVV